MDINLLYKHYGISKSSSQITIIKDATFIVLIPKKPRVLELKDFRPISLVTGVHKIIVKVLANRLQIVLEKVVSDSQNAFISGRQILDSILIANECLNNCLKSGQKGVLYTLRGCGFSQKWRKWIYTCISTVHYFLSW